MANDFRSEFEITLDGKKRILKFGYAALRSLEARYQSLTKLMVDTGGLLPTSFLIDALVAGLAHHGDKRLTAAWIQNHIPIHELKAFNEQVAMALLLTLNGPEDTAAMLGKGEDDAPATEADGGNPTHASTGEASSS